MKRLFEHQLSFVIVGKREKIALAIDEAISHRPLPLVIGVTGHRDLREVDKPHLVESLRKVFAELRASYPSTPFLIISSLAEGADRLAAEVAFEFDAEMICPLPFARELYETDFATEESKEEFASLLAKANHWFELPLLEGYQDEDVAEHGHVRDMHYAQCGAYTALRSQILIALWNGEYSKLLGGSSDVVQFKLKGVGAPYARAHSALDVVDSGPVYQIVTPRQSQFNTPADTYSLKKHYPEGSEFAESSSNEFEIIYSRIDEFNRDAIVTGSDLQEERAKSSEYVMSSELRKRLSPKGMAMIDLYTIADTLSINYQRSTLRTLRVLLSFVFLAAVFFHVYTHLYSKTSTFLYVYLGAFAIAYMWHFFASRRKLQAKYLDYRALAEGLRIQFFWQVAGFHDSVAFYYLRKQKSALDWVRHAVRSSLMSVLALQNPDPSRSGPRKHSSDEMHILDVSEEESIEVVREHWVRDQAKYFTKSAHREHRKLHRFERMINTSLALGFLLSVVQLMVAPNHYLWLAIGLTAVGAGMLHTYTEKRAFNQHSKQYERMGNLFNRADAHLDGLLATRQYDEAREFMGELGREALIENGDWIHTHRDRPIEVPKGA